MADFQPFVFTPKGTFQAAIEERGSFRGCIRAADPHASPPPEPQSEQPRPDQQELLETARAEAEQRVREELAAEQATLEQEAASIRPLLEALQTARADALAQSARDVGAIIEALCRRILSDQLALDERAVTALIERSLAAFPPEDEITIFVPESALEAVSQRLPGHTLRADPQMTSGCRIETRHAALEATLDTALQGVREAIATWLESQT